MNSYYSSTYPLDCWINENVELSKGDVIRILRAFPGDTPLRVTQLENITRGWTRTSHDEGVVMTKSSIIYKDPIVGKVDASRIEGNNVTHFTIKRGTYENYIFIEAGQIQQAQNAIIHILKNEVNAYLKIWDNYISSDTVKLLSNVPKGTNILVLTQTIYDKTQVKQEVLKLNNKIEIRIISSNVSHDRFICTTSEVWTIGHSLKDIGKKYTQIIKMPSSAPAESAFDSNWIQSTVFYVSPP
jgi:hypothetical protein